jgi:ribosomal-protein-alanine N-acetyltransferase
MPELKRLDADHAAALLRFERANRAYFARFISDRGDDYFADFAGRHATLLAEQEAGQHHLHVLIDEAGVVLGRFNLFDVADGAAELGFRLAEHATGRGVATAAVGRVCELARDSYGLHRLTAVAALTNAGSLGVLRRNDFVPVGEVHLHGKDCLRHIRDLTPTAAIP